MSKLWDGEPDIKPTAGEIDSADKAQAFLEKQRLSLRKIADSLAADLTAKKPGRPGNGS